MSRPSPGFLLFLGALVALAIVVPAFADDTLSWNQPTQYVDGTPLDPNDIEATLIRWYLDATATVVAGTSAPVPAPATSVVLPRDPALASTRCYQAATLMRAPNGQTSAYAPAARVCKTIAPPPPPKKSKPPTGLTAH